jgi:two-component system CheB/CheR fusion protein
VPIIGIGASAGGLEALSALVAQLPADAPFATVVIQHLDPTQEGHTVELLQSHSTLPVAPITDQLAVRPGQVYVLPAGQQVTLEQGYLRLAPPAEPRGLRLPIDTFFRSLAAERQHEATGVVLSGMGADGTLGLRAIREAAGATFAQAPEEARFDAMPRSAIDAGVVDVVAMAAELPARIRGYLEHRPGAGPAVPRLGDRDAATIDRMLALLRAHTGRDFTQYKRSTIQRRIERRMGIHQRRLPEEYLALLADNPQELDLLFRELLIGVTSFFRDPALWEQLATVVIPALLAGKPDRGTVRAWVAGCSTGEEAYSLAIAFREALLARHPRPNLTIQVFATDLDEDAIRKARAGTYPASIAADVSPGRLEQFFLPEDGGFRVRPEVRESVVFAVQDIIADPPFIKLDLLSCRNVLIYLDAPLQRKMMTMFHYALRPGGLLVLGTAETTGTATALFAPADAKLRLYRRLEGGRTADVLDFPGTASRAARGGAAAGEPPPAGVRTVPNLEQLADRLMLQEFAPAAVLCTPRGDLLYISGRTGRFLEPAAGKANLNLLAMARDGLRDPLAEALRAAMGSAEAVHCHDLPVEATPGALRVDVTVRRLAEPTALAGLLLVVFAEAAGRAESVARGTPAAPEAGGVAERGRLQADLLRAQELVKRLRDEMQTSQEELRTANEELQSTNEELQSTNEELTTSKEEMQSMNEELQTVNTELLARVDELSRASSDMRNLLNSTSIATLFLDAKLQVRRFTPAMTSIVKLIPGDVGRPITDLVLSLEYPALAADVRDVLQTLIFREVQVRASDNRWFTVRIMPYQGHDQRIDGVVITFLDNTALKRLELGMRQLLDDLRPPQGVPPAASTLATGIERLLREVPERPGTRLAAP